MSVFSQFTTGAIKSTQRGVINLSGAATATATITSVDTAKTQLRYLGVKSDDNLGNNQRAMVRIQLTNSTTITAERFSSGGASDVSWELTEYY